MFPGTKIESRFESEGKKERKETERKEKKEIEESLELRQCLVHPLVKDGLGWRGEKTKRRRGGGTERERRVCVRPYALTLTRIQVTYTFA